MSRKLLSLCLLLGCYTSGASAEKKIRAFFKKLFHKKEPASIANPFLMRLTKQNISQFFPQTCIYTVNEKDQLLYQEEYPTAGHYVRELLEKDLLITLSRNQLRQLSKDGKVNIVYFYSYPAFNVAVNAFVQRHFCVGIIVPDMQPATVILLERTRTA